MKHLLFLISLCTTLSSLAQCAMCKATAEQSLEQGSTAANWINGGILYLLIVPYLAIMIIFFIWYKKYKKEKKY